jgi:hypothetical protein
MISRYIRTCRRTERRASCVPSTRRPQAKTRLRRTSYTRWPVAAARRHPASDGGQARICPERGRSRDGGRGRPWTGTTWQARKVDLASPPADAVNQNEAEKWKVDAGKLKYVRDVRGVRTTC